MSEGVINTIELENANIGSAYAFRTTINDNFNKIKTSINDNIKVEVDEIKETQDEISDRVQECAKTHVEAGITQTVVNNNADKYKPGDICITW